MSPATEQGQRRYLPALRFRALTRFYDPAIRLTTREGAFRRWLLGQAGICPGDRVLDLGCGTGTLAVLIKQIVPGAEVLGLDADAEVLDRARRKAAEAGVEVAFQRGFSDELPYEDGSLDAVVATLFFHHLVLETKRRTVAEIARVLKAGGELHVADWGRPADPLMRLLSLQVRLGDGLAPTRDNLSGALPRIFEAAGLVAAAETGRLRTVFGTLAFYRAERREGAS